MWFAHVQTQPDVILQSQPSDGNDLYKELPVTQNTNSINDNWLSWFSTKTKKQRNKEINKHNEFLKLDYYTICSCLLLTRSVEICYFVQTQSLQFRVIWIQYELSHCLACQWVELIVWHDNGVEWIM